MSSLSKGILGTLKIHELTGLEHATSRTESERRIDWANLTDKI